jgi:hypothetical protein
MGWGCAHYIQILYWKCFTNFSIFFFFCVSLINFSFKKKKEKRKKKIKNRPALCQARTCDASSSSRAHARERPRAEQPCYAICLLPFRFFFPWRWSPRFISNLQPEVYARHGNKLETSSTKISPKLLNLPRIFAPIYTPIYPLYIDPKIPNFCAARLREFLVGVRRRRRHWSS